MKIAFEKYNGLVPAIVQDHATGEVLMLGFMNEEALAETQRTRQAVFFSRSRNKLMEKGRVQRTPAEGARIACRLRFGHAAAARASHRAREYAMKDIEVVFFAGWKMTVQQR